MPTDVIFRAVMGNWREWTTRGNEGSPIGPFIEINWLRLVESCRIAKGEYNWPFYLPGHCTSNIFGECSGLG